MDDPSTLMPPQRRASGARALPVLTLLYHPDVARVGQRLKLDGRVELGRATVFDSKPIEDRYVSRTPLELTRVMDGVSIEVEKTLRATVDGEPVNAGWRKHIDRDALATGVVIELSERVVVLLHLATAQPAPRDHGLVGGSDAIARVRDDIDRVADLDVPVLLRGETGTGKELVARAIHDAGGRDRPFVAVNVAALPPTTAASELFGHVRGAFTGASHDHAGLFAAADGGTLFLDEIGETPFDVQPMLLRVLETSEVTPLGGGRVKKLAIRVITATDADLETQIAESGFREALFHRLAGYQLVVPPLRARRDDIGRLLVHFLRAEVATTGDLARLERQRDAEHLWLPASLVGRMARFHWPGNVRQLKNAARQLAIASRGRDEVQVDAILERMLARLPAVEPPPAPVVAARRDPSEISDDDLLAALRAHNWRAVPAAAQLGVSRSSLYNLIDRSKRIRKAKEIPAAEVRRVLADCGGEVDTAAAELEVSPRALKLRIAEL